MYKQENLHYYKERKIKQKKLNIIYASVKLAILNPQPDDAIGVFLKAKNKCEIYLFMAMQGPFWQ